MLGVMYEWDVLRSCVLRDGELIMSCVWVRSWTKLTLPCEMRFKLTSSYVGVR